MRAGRLRPRSPSAPWPSAIGRSAGSRSGTEPERAGARCFSRAWRRSRDRQAGPRGVLAMTADERVEVSPTPVTVVNGLGAGDAFGGAGLPRSAIRVVFARTIRFASAAGALVAEHLECATAMPDRATVRALLTRTSGGPRDRFRPSGLGLDNSAYVRPSTPPRGPYAVAITPPVRGAGARVAAYDTAGGVARRRRERRARPRVTRRPSSCRSPGIRRGHRGRCGCAARDHACRTESVFAGATDVAYAGRGSRVTSPTPPASPAGGPGPEAWRCRGKAPKTGAAHHDRRVPVEHRGAGIASREVRAFRTAGVLDADSILVCEVLTPSGNWSSWPPHKHDTERPGLETVLGRSTTSRRGPPTPAGPILLAISGFMAAAGPAGGHSGRGAHGRCRARAAWLAWTGDRGAGRGSLPPQRHGRGRGQSGLAHL